MVKSGLRPIEALWRSLRRRPEVIPLTEVQRKELDRRLDELNLGAIESIRWKEVKPRLRDRSK